MSVDLAIVVAVFILIITAMVLGVIFSGRRQAAHEDELKRAASARGWKLDITNERGYRINRWTGSTDGISWTAESMMRSAGGNRRDRRRHVARWHGQWNPGINTPIVAMGVPKGKEQIGTTIAEGDGFFAKMAQKAAGFAFDKAIDVYFGDEAGRQVDAGAMRRVEAATPGFIVMAANRDEGARVLSQGFERAIADASNDKDSVLSEEDRPWILLRPNGVSLARMERYRTIEELDGFVKAGVTLTRAFKFGRPTA